MALDQDALNLAKAIRQHETGNRAVAGQSGEMASRYQFLPSTWSGWAKRYLGDSNAPITLENENKVAYMRIKEWKDQGYNPAQIASLWNSGSPIWEGKVGKNSSGVNYDVPKYVNSVYGIYKQYKGESLKNNVSVEDEDKNRQNDELIAEMYDAPFSPRTDSGALGEVLSMAGNIPTSSWNFVKGVFNFLNPYRGGQELGKAIGEFGVNIQRDARAGVESPTVGDVVKGLPEAAYESLVPQGARSFMEGMTGWLAGDVFGDILGLDNQQKSNLLTASEKKMTEAERYIVSDPIGQVGLPYLILRGLTGKETAVEKPRSVEFAEKAVEKAKDAAGAVADTGKKIAEQVVSTSSGLRPETIREIIKNPKEFTSRNIEIADRTSLAESIFNKIEKRRNDLSAVGKGYEDIRGGVDIVKIGDDPLLKVLEKYKILLDKGKIIRTTETRLPLKEGDVKALEDFNSIFGGKKSLTAEEFLNARALLSEMAKYDATKSNASQKIARDLRGEYDKLGKDQIKNLKELDEVYSKEKKELSAVQKEYLTKDKATGEWRLKDTATTRITNATNKGREEIAKRLEKIKPGITEEINIIKAMEDIKSLQGNVVGRYYRAAPLAGGFLVGGPVGAIIATLASSPRVVVKLLRMYGESMNFKREKIESIINKIKKGKDLNASDKTILSDMINMVKFVLSMKMDIDTPLKNYMKGKQSRPLTNDVLSNNIMSNFETKLSDVVNSINEGGITFDVNNLKNLGGETYTSVGFYPERSKVFSGPLKESDIIDYVSNNLDLLGKKNHTLGGWYDTEAKQLWLDVAGVVKDEKTAIGWGKKLNQKAVFNLERFEEIPTGGTGENIKGLPSIEERAKILENINS